MKLLKLILVRHGQTVWNESGRFQGISDIALSAEGRQQALSLAKSLKDISLAEIYTSPLTRARETAGIVSQYQHCEVRVEEGLKELNQGELEGLTAQDLRDKYPAFFEKWTQEPSLIRLPQGESLKDLQDRAWASVGRILKRHSEGNVMLVAHSFVNRVILCRVLSMSLNDFRCMRQDAGATNILEFTGRGVVLTRLNDTCHLRRFP
jgi:broad specificity phosphatase PhoE